MNNLDLKLLFGENIFISQDIGYEKPKPQAFFKVTSEFNVLPSECLFIGDSFKNDVLGALNVGMAAIWLTNGKKYQEIHKRKNLNIFEGEINTLLKQLLDYNYSE
ncbi:HAD family hydrolase [Staphylococcus simiae]|uniref:HAD family hydrolase n=1 Tax=Staphylococcus simiae TaxID=308354 RepID=UPI00325AB218